ncbi:MAG: endonuclease MutS2 [Oscillospiraceae bacterium]|nr:endonuclease MutS2 [Oscillospiraceae bacterium]
MIQKYTQALEFNKILKQLADGACCSEAKEYLAHLQPFADADSVEQALLETDTMMTLMLKNGTPRISGVEGVLGTVQRAEKGGILSPAELLLVASTLRNFKMLQQWYNQLEQAECPLNDVFFTLCPQPTLEKNIYESILSDTEIADTASNSLYEIRTKIRRTESAIRDKLDGMIKNQSTQKYLQDAVVSIRSGRFVVPVRAEFKGEVSGVIHDVSSTGATLFVEPTAVVEANAKILQLKNLEKEEIDRILTAFSNQVANLQPLFGVSYEGMIKIDILIAKAKLALAQNANKPTVNRDFSFQLIKARHPLIDKTKVVPVDIALGEAYDTMIITGPNTGGKTVTLKTAGLLCLMAQAGLLIPANERSSVCVFREILVDIGDEQSIEQSLSTFSGHIKNITQILGNTAEDTLVLLDELGAGTDPAEGAALAVSIIEQLRKSGTRIMATTHYGELKIFALETAGVQNASCEFNVETLRPTYKLSVGVPGKSNAFLISEKLGVPTEIIDVARLHLSQEDKRFEQVLAQLEDLKVELKNGQEEIEYLKHAAEHQVEAAQAKCEELIRQGEQELAMAREKANAITKNVQDSAYNLMDELKQLQKQENISAQQRAIRAREIARKETEKLYHASDAEQARKIYHTPLKSVKIGDSVMIASLDKQATVTALPDKNGNVEVLAGIIKTKVKLNDLYAVAKQQQVQPKKNFAKATNPNAKPRSANMEINLLGMNVDEAILEVDRFIDAAIMTGLGTVYLVHGKGTGALRKGIQTHLKTHRSVKSYRLGTYGEGDAGVTVVELK